MSTLSWPTSRAFLPAAMRWGVNTPRMAWAAPYTGQVQSISHLADRLTCTLSLPPVRRAEAGPREAYIMELHSAGHWVTMYHRQRPAPVGTMRGSPTVRTSAIAGARTLVIDTSGTPTLVGGDMLGVGSQLLMVGYAGATGVAGVITVPLALPLRAAVSAGAAVTWDKPTGTFQIVGVAPEFSYQAPGHQMGLEVMLAEVYA